MPLRTRSFRWWVRITPCSLRLTNRPSPMITWFRRSMLRSWAAWEASFVSFMFSGDGDGSPDGWKRQCWWQQC
jgi:hypothetical protein